MSEYCLCKAVRVFLLLHVWVVGEVFDLHEIYFFDVVLFHLFQVIVSTNYDFFPKETDSCWIRHCRHFLNICLNKWCKKIFRVGHGWEHFNLAWIFKCRHKDPLSLLSQLFKFLLSYYVGEQLHVPYELTC